MIRVDDPADPRLDDYRDLRDLERRAGVEAARGVLIAEGTVPIRTLLGSGRRVRSLLLVAREHARLAADLASVDVPVYVAELDLLRAVAGFDVHRGALAAADRFEPPAAAELLRTARRVVPCWRARRASRTSPASSATRRRSASTACCSTRPAATRWCAGRCASPPATR